ncbi:sodium/glutamate symporter [Vibrio breoganii]|uniref:Sodium/glutamate symporter n=1 Tax=Vibrio breoganii TaxID=553239 RepID=A0AAJ3VP43_9VIBR|nr:sodium/glutamate symporter [Vibrio breoganii]ANO33128.1 sodium/glutamate symporter [Vibrio breoganii]MDN3714772.1 sodium/glutamate symporter [Vibrio breoganii]OCH77810.1 sodium/glutamate symporter [Vibrio breoganii]OED90093.1 sodium/glutamate symporter [Vibrio breoganii ZF-55]OED93594.1 sodium/glutamate symporter [Vibrio breoganii ZF-29]
MSEVLVPPLVSFTIAIALLFIGKAIIERSEVLKKYSLPEPVIGGFVCAATVAVLYYVFDIQVTFTLEVRDFLLLYFFAGIGLQADLKTLIKGGRPLFILLVLAGTFIVLQNVVGMSVATAFGLDPKAGLLSGSVSLIGGVGTTLAWAPTFVEEYGISNAMELGVASNTVGLIAACVIGGPIANYLLNKHKVSPSNSEDVAVGAFQDKQATIELSHYGVLRAWLFLNVTLMLGYTIGESIEAAGYKLPLFVSCLIAGILIGNIGRALFQKRQTKEKIEDGRKGLAMISDICLGMFLTMALMGLHIWDLDGMFGYISVIMSAQILLSLLFTILVVYYLMGRNYDSVVICSGFGGITLGSTATAIVNMTAVTSRYGASPQAFIVVPLVCGFFIDIVNALVISFFVGL